MQTPACVGMMRSGSRLTWQILKHLTLTTSRPENWVIPEWVGKPEHDRVWPIKSHEYVTTVPVIFTYRHPVEAFLSLQAKLKLDIGKEGITDGYKLQNAWADAMRNTGTAWDVYKQLEKDQATGRPVLFLRYEDYYEKPDLRVLEIAEFMNVELNVEQLAEILEDTSINQNFMRGRALAFHQPDKPFSGTATADGHAIQREHVSAQTFGIPGKWLETQSEFVSELRRSKQPALQALVEMCEYMGYKI